MIGKESTTETSNLPSYHSYISFILSRVSWPSLTLNSLSSWSSCFSLLISCDYRLAPAFLPTLEKGDRAGLRGPMGFHAPNEAFWLEPIVWLFVTETLEAPVTKRLLLKEKEILQVVYTDNVELHKDASHALQLPAGSGGEERSRSE